MINIVVIVLRVKNMSLFTNVVLSCLTVIELLRCVISLCKLSMEYRDDTPPLDDEMIKRLYA